MFITLMECALRLSGHQPKPLGWEQLLQMDSTITFHTKRIWTTPRIMSDSHSHPGSADKPQKKILFLGDPFVGQRSEFEGKTILSILGDLFQSENIGVQSFNVYVPGYGPEQEYSLMMESLLPKVRPDLIVWGYDVDDYHKLNKHPLYLRSNGSLRYIPAIFHGLYLQVVFYNSALKIFPNSRALRIFAHLLEKMSLTSIFVSGNNYEISLRINQMVDDFAQKGVPVLVVRAPNLWSISNIEESRKWRFFKDMGRLLPNFLDANEEFIRVTPDTPLKIDSVFESDGLLSQEGRRRYANIIFNYIERYSLLNKP